MGGETGAESRVGKARPSGSRPAFGTSAGEQAAPVTLRVLRGQRVLVVDDNETN